MKKLLSIIFILGMFHVAHAAYPTYQLQNGGTGWSTSTPGDLLVGTTSTQQYTRLPVGANGLCVTSNGTSPVWSSCGSGFSTTSTDYWLTTKTTTNLGEGTNLYYTNARVQSLINGSSTIAQPAGVSTGNVIGWNGSSWVSVSTTTLGIEIPSSIVFIDGNRTDSYVADGTHLRPFKTHTAAFSYVASSGLTSVEYVTAPATYVEGSLTPPNIPTVWSVGGATLVLSPGAGVYTGSVNISGDVDIYDMVLLGNFTDTDSSLTNPHSINNSFIEGSVYLTGNATIVNSAIVDQPAASSTIEIAVGSLANVLGTNIQCAINVYGTSLSSGTLNLNDDNVQDTVSTRYLIMSTSTGSILHISGASMENFGTGGAINMPNGATLLNPNEISNVGIILGVGSTNAITAGSSASLLFYYAYDLSGTRIYATGTNLGSFSLATLNEEGQALLNINGGFTGISNQYPTGQITVGNASSTSEFGGNISSPFFDSGMRQEFVLQNESFDNASWSKLFGETVTANTIPNPRQDATTADVLNNAGTSNSQVYQCVNTTINGNWTFSVWMKTSSGTPSVSVVLASQNSGATSTIATTTYTVNSTWQRYATTGFNESGSMTSLCVSIVNGMNSVAVWGAQLEPSPYARPYAGTVTSTGITTPTENVHAYGTLAVTGSIVGAGSASGITYITASATGGQGGFSDTFGLLAQATTTPTKAYGFLIDNTTAATAGTPQYSPVTSFQGNYWDPYLSVSTSTAFGMQVQATTTNTLGTATSSLNFMAFSNATNKYVNILSLQSNGGVGAAATSTFTGNLRVTNYFQSLVSFNGDLCDAVGMCWTESTSTPDILYHKVYAIRRDGKIVPGTILLNPSGEMIYWIDKDGNTWQKGTSNVGAAPVVNTSLPWYAWVFFGLSLCQLIYQLTRKK